MKKALVIDDHPITHLGCRRLLGDMGYDEVLQAENAEEAYGLAEQNDLALIVLDLGLPGEGGLAMIEPLKARAVDTPILIFSMNEQDIFAQKALENGASGYLSKHAPSEEFHKAVETVTQGEVYLEPAMATRLATSSLKPKSDLLSQLTKRELEALRLIGKGHSLQTIADEMNVSYKTAANMSSNIKQKLGAENFAQLLRAAIKSEEL